MVAKNLNQIVRVVLLASLVSELTPLSVHFNDHFPGEPGLACVY